MAFKYLLHQLAEQEYETSLEWYEKRSERTAENFIMTVKYQHKKAMKR